MHKHRQVKPLPLDEYKFTIPEIQSFRLDNGLQVRLVERHNLPLTRINLMVDCGSKIDPENKKGLSNLFSMSIDEGAGGMDALQLSNEFDFLGSDFDMHCSNDTIYFLSRSLSENLERTIELFSSVVRTPHLDEKEFLKEKRKVKTRLLQIRDDSDDIAQNTFEYFLYNRRHPYAFPVLGREQDLDNISIEDIRHFYSGCMSPNDANLIFVGNISRGQTEELAQKYFAGWTEIPSLNKDISDVSEHPAGIFIIDKPGSVQTEIRCGHLTPKRNPADYFSRVLMNMVLGGQFSSRINLNLRENKGYTYGAFSNFNYYKDSGFFYVSTSVNLENTKNALDEIMKELNLIKNGVTEEELTFAKTSMMRKFPSNFETNGQIASSVSRMVLYKLPDDHFKKYLEIIHDVTIEQVNEAARKFILPDRAIVMLVGDKKEILKQFSDDQQPVELSTMGEPLS
jgi:zinc protease